jgi:AraC-like DNA-binding protein
VYREHRPSPALRPYVACYWTFTSALGGEQRILPDGCIDLIVDLRRARGAIVGTMTRAVMERAETFDALGVRFRPGEASAVLALPAPELTDRSVPLRSLWASAASELAERLAEARTLPERLRILDDTLIARIGTRWADWRVRRAVGLIEAAGGQVGIRGLADGLGLGERQLERLFVDRVGIGPKRFARVVRLQRVLGLLGAPAVDLATIAVTGGFSDASHVVREIRALCGVTPAALAAERAMSVPSNRPAEAVDIREGRR